jgi:threonine-phosphate decarboxylase
VTRYPDDREASRHLAAVLGTDPSVLVLTNGGSEAIALVAALEGVGDVVEPEFSLYRRHLPRLEAGGPRWRSNPSNPLGRLAPPDASARVWDESFYPLATGRWSRGDAGCWRLGSLTKVWACPGLRLGYALAPDPGSADRLRRHRPEWSVNGLALAALPHLLETTDLPGWASSIRSLRAEFVTALRALGFAVDDTDVNWVLVHRPDLREDLAPLGVLVRDATSFGLPGVARVALPPVDRLAAVVDAFARVGP